MKVIALCGSARPHSSTERALAVALAGAAAAGAEVQVLNLREFALPWCDGRPEGEYHGEAARFRALVLGADALLVGSPEYHGSLSGGLKNALDLIGPDELKDRMVGLLATARGEAGAMNTLNHLRHIFRWMGAWVLPTQVSIPKSQEAFAADGAIAREGLEPELRALGAEVVRYAGLLAGGPAR